MPNVAVLTKPAVPKRKHAGGRPTAYRAEYCDRVVVMRTGKVVEQGSVADVIHAPQHPYTSDLVESARPVVLR